MNAARGIVNALLITCAGASVGAAFLAGPGHLALTWATSALAFVAILIAVNRGER